jgi:hypothetical protein
MAKVAQPKTAEQPKSEPKFGAEIAAAYNGSVLQVQWIPTLEQKAEWTALDAPTREDVLAALQGMKLVENDAVSVYLSESLQHPGLCQEIEVQGDMGGFSAVLMAAGEIARRLLEAGIVDHVTSSVYYQGGTDGRDTRLALQVTDRSAPDPGGHGGAAMSPRSGARLQSGGVVGGASDAEDAVHPQGAGPGHRGRATGRRAGDLE